MVTFLQNAAMAQNCTEVLELHCKWISCGICWMFFLQCKTSMGKRWITCQGFRKWNPKLFGRVVSSDLPLWEDRRRSCWLCDQRKPWGCRPECQARTPWVCAWSACQRSRLTSSVTNNTLQLQRKWFRTPEEWTPFSIVTLSLSSTLLSWAAIKQVFHIRTKSYRPIEPDSVLKSLALLTLNGCYACNESTKP